MIFESLSISDHSTDQYWQSRYHQLQADLFRQFVDEMQKTGLSTDRIRDIIKLIHPYERKYDTITVEEVILSQLLSLLQDTYLQYKSPGGRQLAFFLAIVNSGLNPTLAEIHACFSLAQLLESSNAEFIQTETSN